MGVRRGWTLGLALVGLLAAAAACGGGEVECPAMAEACPEGCRSQGGMQYDAEGACVRPIQACWVFDGQMVAAKTWLICLTNAAGTLVRFTEESGEGYGPEWSFCSGEQYRTVWDAPDCAD